MHTLRMYNKSTRQIKTIPLVLTYNLPVQEDMTCTVQLHSTGPFWPFLDKNYTPMSQGNLFSIVV